MSQMDKHSQAPQEGAHEGPHEGPIRTPKQLMGAIVASFVVPIVAIIMLVNFVNFGSRTGAGSDAMQAEAVAKRLQRVGSVEIRDANAPVVLRSGEQVYSAQCAACHVTGAAGAPKFGDAGAWGPRLKSGYEALLSAVVKGKGAMGAQAGGDFSDHELGRAVVHLTNSAGGKFSEPTAPAAAASAPK